MRKFILIIVLTVYGFVMLPTSTINLVYKIKHYIAANKTEGIVQAVWLDEPTKGGIITNKKVRFINVEGKEEVFIDRSYDNGNKIGDKVKVVYNMNGQDKPYVFLFQEFALPELLLIITSSIATFVSIREIRKNIRKLFLIK